MKLAIMQPYFLPYIGYYQLIAAVDVFVVYDNIKYTKKGWINRNRLLKDGEDMVFTLPLKKGSDSLTVVEREISADFHPNKLLRDFKIAYGAAPQYARTLPLLERIVGNADRNLFRFIHGSIVDVCAHLAIDTEIRVSSDIAIDHGLRREDKVLAVCQAVGADTYINAIGGKDLYSRETFHASGVDIKFIQAKPFEYAQFGAPFTPWLSIVDVLMFNPLDSVRQRILTGFELL